MNLRNDRKGMTLVETIAALALTGILMATVSAALGFYMRMSLQVREVSHAQLVCEEVMDVLKQEVLLYGVPESEEDFLLACFGEEVYPGYMVERLTFTRDEPENHPDVIRIELVVRNEQTGISASASDYVRLYESCMPEEEEIPLLHDIP